MTETVEDIPRNAIPTNLPWNWEGYGGYLDAIEKLNLGINVTGMVGDCAVRFHVMGEHAVEEQARPSGAGWPSSWASRSIAARSASR